LRICDEIAMGADASSSVTSNVMAARWRSVSDTIRVDRTRTDLPAGVRHRISRLYSPVRKSSRRSYSDSSATGRSSGSSST
jgi:hypothetical protein